MCGIEVVEFCSAEQGLNCGGTFSGAFGTGEEPVFLAERDGSYRVFDGIVVHRQVPAVGVADEALPAFQGVVDGFSGAAAIGGMKAGLQ